MKKLKNESFFWAMFIIRIELDAPSVCLDKNVNKEPPPDQFLIPQAVELDWIDLVKVNEFALPDLNAEITRAARCSIAAEVED